MPRLRAMATILVTGANRGIGLELACQYAEADYRVIATCRSPETANALTHLHESHPNVEIARLDVSDPNTIKGLARGLLERGEALDILINNAGVLVQEPVGSWTADAFSNTLRTNVIGPALVLQALSELLGPGAKVINISSGLGSFGMAIDFGGMTGTYAVSKAALNMAVVQMAPAYKAKGVTVVAFNPGWVKTDMGGQEATLDVQQSVSWLRKSIDEVGLERSGEFIEYNGEPLPY